MKRCLGSLLFLMLATAAPAAEGEATRIHWIGSAWMNFHNLAPQCSAWLEGRGGFGKVEHSADRIWPLHAMMDEGGRKMQLYDKERTLPQMIVDVKAREYDVLVLAMQLEMVADEDNDISFMRTLDFLAAEAKRHKARLVFAAYGTAFNDKCARGMERLRPLAQRYEAVICPWWSAMRAVAEERPGAVMLGVPNKGHPAIGSIYLNLCAFVFALTSMPPDRLALPLEHRGWDKDKPAFQLTPEEARFFQHAAWQAWESVRD